MAGRITIDIIKKESERIMKVIQGVHIKDCKCATCVKK